MKDIILYGQLKVSSNDSVTDQHVQNGVYKNKFILQTATSILEGGLRRSPKPAAERCGHPYYHHHDDLLYFDDITKHVNTKQLLLKVSMRRHVDLKRWLCS
jgi:hypothetical protein